MVQDGQFPIKHHKTLHYIRQQKATLGEMHLLAFRQGVRQLLFVCILKQLCVFR